MLKWIVGWPYAVWWMWKNRLVFTGFCQGIPMFSPLEPVLGQVVFISLGSEDIAAIQENYPPEYWN